VPASGGHVRGGDAGELAVGGAREHDDSATRRWASAGPSTRSAIHMPTISSRTRGAMRPYTSSIV
jgi:hypothetical protein